MKNFLLIVIVLFSSCNIVRTTYNAKPSAIQTQEPVPLMLGGRHYEGRVGDLVLIKDGYWGLPDEPRKCFIEDASSLFYVRFDINPLDQNKMNSFENVELLTNIKSLRIYGENLDSVDFSPLSVLKTLKYLTIEGEKLDCVDFSPLSALSALEELIIKGNISSPPDLTSLETLTWIVIKESALESFEGLGAPNVKKMEIQMKTFDSLAPLSNLTELDFLDIETPGSIFTAIGDIKNVPRLKTLFLGTDGIIDLTGIEQLTGLIDLRLGLSATPVNAQGISRLRNLELLVMSIIEDENPSIEYLRGLPNLQSVSINGKSSLWDSVIKEPYQILDVSPLGESPKLEDIDLRGFIIKNVSALNHLENLRYNAIILDESRLFDEAEAERSTKWLIFDVSILRDG